MRRGEFFFHIFIFVIVRIKTWRKMQILHRKTWFVQHFASCLPRKSMERRNVDVSHKRHNKESVSRGHLRISSFHYRRDCDRLYKLLMRRCNGLRWIGKVCHYFSYLGTVSLYWTWKIWRHIRDFISASSRCISSFLVLKYTEL